MGRLDAAPRAHGARDDAVEGRRRAVERVRPRGVAGPGRPGAAQRPLPGRLGHARGGHRERGAAAGCRGRAARHRRGRGRFRRVGGLAERLAARDRWRNPAAGPARHPGGRPDRDRRTRAAGRDPRGRERLRRGGGGRVHAPRGARGRVDDRRPRARGGHDGGRARHQGGVHPGPHPDHPARAGRDPGDPDAAPALDRRAAAADRHGRALVRRGTRRLGARVRRRLRLPRGRPGGAAVRVRVPRGARRRLQHLPHDAGARGERAARHPCGRAARARGHRRGHHVGGARARRDVRGARRAADPLPRADLVHRRIRGAARHVPRAIAARAGARVRPRSRDLVAVEALARTRPGIAARTRSLRRPTPSRPMRRASAPARHPEPVHRA